MILNSGLLGLLQPVADAVANLLYAVADLL